MDCLVFESEIQLYAAHADVAPEELRLFQATNVAICMNQADFLGPHMELLTKPFTLDVLASRVANMLLTSTQGKAGSQTTP